MGTAAAVAGIGVAAAAATAATVGLGTSFFIAKENATIAFETILGSAKKADAFIRQLSKFAAQTPFEFPGLVSAAQRMLALGFASREVVPTLRVVADQAAALGKGQEGVDLITTALGQLKLKGKASTEELLQLTEAGVDGFTALRKALGLTRKELDERLRKGTIDGARAVNIILADMEKKTKGVGERQSRTLSGAFSTLKDQFSALAGAGLTPILREITKGILGVNEAFNDPQLARRAARWGRLIVTETRKAIPKGKNLFGDVVGFVKSNDETFRRTGRFIGEVALAFKGSALAILPLVRDLLPQIPGLIDKIEPGLKRFASGFGEISAQVTNAIGPRIEPAVAAIGELLGSIGDVASRVAPAVGQIASAFTSEAVDTVRSLANALTSLAPAIETAAGLAASFADTMSGLIPSGSVAQILLLGIAFSKLARIGLAVAGIAAAAKALRIIVSLVGVGAGGGVIKMAAGFLLLSGRGRALATTLPLVAAGLKAVNTTTAGAGAISAFSTALAGTAGAAGRAVGPMSKMAKVAPGLRTLFSLGGVVSPWVGLAVGATALIALLIKARGASDTAAAAIKTLSLIHI